MKEKAKLKVSWANPDICSEDSDSLKECFDSHWISQGAKVEEFERLVALYSNRKYCVAVNSGSSALVCLLIALGVSNTCEIIIPAMSFIAVPFAVTMSGALPVLADISRDTGMIDAKTVLPCISTRTRAVIGIDYSGFANDWSDISSLCEDRGIILMIDAASSFLAHTNSTPAGSFGKAAIFSFHAAKPLTTGEGGAIVTDDENLALLLRQIRNHGETPGKKYSYDVFGGNYRLTDLAASLGISQIRRKEQILSNRRQVISYYLEKDALRNLALEAYKDSRFKSNGFTFTILSQYRERLRETLSRHGIETRVMWPYCVDHQPVYGQLPFRLIGEVNSARYFSGTCVSLPVHSGISKEEIDYIAQVIEETI
ncbi:MAG: DegT/DnrJ/EryC1/StrS family aminotransferase [Acidobacteriota bacterium]